MISNDFPENGYRDLVDAESFIKYFLVQTFMQNVDFFRKGTETGEHIGSVFLYKDKGGKIGAGPLWDLNWSFQEFSGMMAGQNGNMGPNLYPYAVFPLFARFFDDPEFLVRYQEIWNEKMPQIESMRSFITEIVNKVEGTNAAGLTSFYDRRLTFLKTEYNKVNVRPTNRSFGTTGYNYSQAPARAVTLVSYGEMSGLSANLQKGASSDFEIMSNLNQTPTGKGGYLAAVSIKPKDALAIASYRDTLILSGAKQGSEFTFKVPLSFVVSAEAVSSSSSSEPVSSSSSANEVSAIARSSLPAEANFPASVEIYNLKGNKVTNLPLPKGVYFAKVRGMQSKMFVVK
jgi:hypothetical protein